MPPGGVLLAGNAACPNQAFAIGSRPGTTAGSGAAPGPHLAMQFHVEVDEDKLALWTTEAAVDPAHPSTVQDAATLRAGTRRYLAAQQALADRLYRHWLAG